MAEAPGGEPALTLRYEPRTLDPGAAPVEVAPGVFGVRFELPFALDHVNLWLLEDGGGWTVIDAGLADERSRERWRQLLAGPLAGRPVHRLVVTHFHPDHMGLASWLCGETGAELWTSRTDWLQARVLAQDTSTAFVEAGRRFDHRAGMSEELIETRAARGNLYRTRAEAPPAAFTRLQHGDRLGVDGDDWRILVGRGHAPEMLCLHSPARGVLIAADQVLPKISPNIGVWPAEPEADPLAEFFDSLQLLRELPADTLVLPSHGRPFRGLHTRVDQLIAHHAERLEATLRACVSPATVVEVMPKLFDRELDVHQLQFALCETLAHLNHLVERDRLTRHVDLDGRLRYHSP